jgi:hypothetical protein
MRGDQRPFALRFAAPRESDNRGLRNLTSAAPWRHPPSAAITHPGSGGTDESQNDGRGAFETRRMNSAPIRYPRRGSVRESSASLSRHGPDLHPFDTRKSPYVPDSAGRKNTRSSWKRPCKRVASGSPGALHSFDARRVSVRESEQARLRTGRYLRK